ncbi:MAG: TolC family protein [Endomicrobium sp.]|jgi:outer membrane protein TolC|nr:TolC family protein [Endomicrobium sp.]
MKKTLFTLSLLFITSLACAEKISWDAVVRRTVDTNPLIQSAKLRLENAKQSYNRSLSGYMPIVSLRGNASQGSTDDDFARNYSYGLNASLSLFSGFNTYNDVKQRSAEVKTAQAAYDRIVSDAAYEAATQYINLMWAYETVELSEKILERRKENKDMINLKYNSGNVDAGSLRRVEADVELTSYDLRKAQRYIETASSALLKAIGRKDGGEILETDERLNLSEREVAKPYFADIISKTPEYLTAQYNIEISKAQSAKAKSAWYPDISLSGNLSRSGREWAPDIDGWDAGLSVSYPLFSGGTTIADTKIASNQLKISEENFKNQVNLLEASAVSYFNNLTDAVESISVREYYLSAARLQAEISARKYVNGLSTYQEWYLIENDYINAQKTFLDVKRSAALEKSRWRNFTGEGFAETIGN